MNAMSNSYAAAGVDTEAGDRAVELMKAAVSAPTAPRFSAGWAASRGCSTRRRSRRSRSAARHLDRRRRHEGRHRAGARQARHHRARPGGHGGRRHRGGGREAAVHDRLHRLRARGSRAHRQHRGRHRAGVLGDRHRPGRRRDGRASGAHGRRRLRRGGRRGGRGRGGCGARRRAGARRRRGARAGLVGTALERLLVGAQDPGRRGLDYSSSSADFGGVVGEVLLEPTRLYTGPLVRVLATRGSPAPSTPSRT